MHSLSITFVDHLNLSNFFFFNDTATTEIYTLSLHDALPISHARRASPHWIRSGRRPRSDASIAHARSEEHTSELQSPYELVCRLLLETKKKTNARSKNNKKKKYTAIET